MVRPSVEIPSSRAITEAVRGEKITVGPPFFNRWMVPIGLILLLLTGVGPLAFRAAATLAPALVTLALSLATAGCALPRRP